MAGLVAAAARPLVSAATSGILGRSAAGAGAGLLRIFTPSRHARGWAVALCLMLLSHDIQVSQTRPGWANLATLVPPLLPACGLL